jgi:hypothetical protein
MWLTLIAKNWRLVLFGTAIALSLAYGQMMKFQRDAAREDLHQLQQDVQRERVENQLAIDVVRADSTRTLEVINRDHATILEQTKKGAIAAYKARYPSISFGDMRCGDAALRLPSNFTENPSETGVTGSAENANEGEPIGFLTADFLERASEAAVMIKECQLFIVGNKFPIE